MIELPRKWSGLFDIVGVRRGLVTTKDLVWRIAPIMLFLLLAVVFLFPTVFGGKVLLPAEYLSAMHPWSASAHDSTTPQWNPLMWDGISQFYPWRVHYSRSIASGQIPLWNPYQFCGTPFVANAQTAAFYPLNLLFVVFSPARAFGLSAVLHLFLAGVFTFLLARALGIGRFGSTVAGVVFQFSAFLVVWLELPTLINVAVWLPLVLYLILRSSDETGFYHSVFAGLALGVSILAGHLQVASYVVGAAFLWWIWLTIARTRTHGLSQLGRGAWLTFVTFATSLLIASPQVLPALELAGLSHRVREITAEGYSTYVGNAVPAVKSITLFIPNYFGNPTAGNYWPSSRIDFVSNFMEYALYVGLLPLLFAIMGAIFTVKWRSVGYFVALALISLLLAFGTPLNYIIYHLPGTSALGGPNRVLILFCFSAAMLSGFGAHWFAQMAQNEYSPTKRHLGWRALTVATALFVILFLAAQYVTTASVNTFLSGLGFNGSQLVSSLFSQYLSFATLLLAGLATLAAYTARYVPKTMFMAMALAVIVADLFAFGFGFNPICDRDQVYPETRLTRWLKENAEHSRVMPISPRWSLSETPRDPILPPNSATIYGFLDMQGYDSLFARNYKEFVDSHLGMDSSPQENGNMLLLQCYVAGWPVGTAEYVLSTEPIPDLEQVHYADGVGVYRVPDASIAYVVDGAGSVLASGEAIICKQSSNGVELTVSTDRPSKLVLAVAWFPGWRVWVDGMERALSPFDGVFQSVAIHPADSTVSFRFEPESYIVGMYLGLLGLFASGIAIGTRLTGRQ